MITVLQANNRSQSMKCIMRTIYFFVAISFALATSQAEDIQKEFAFPKIDDVMQKLSQLQKVEQLAPSAISSVGEKDVNLLLRRICKGGSDASQSVIALGKIGTPEAVDALVEVIQQGKDQALRYVALDALNSSDATSAVPRMVSLLDSLDLHVTEKAVILGYLSKHPSVDVESAIIKSATDPELELFALSALAEIGSEVSLAFIRSYLENGTGEYMPVAKYSLRRIEARMGGVAPDSAFDHYGPILSGTFAHEEDFLSHTNSAFVLEPCADMQSDRIKSREEERIAYRDMLRRAHEIESIMGAIQERVFQKDNVKAAMRKYEALVEETIIDMKKGDSKHDWSKSEDDAQEIWRQRALLRDDVLAAQNEVWHIIRQEFTAVNPSAEALNREYLVLVNKVLNQMPKEIQGSIRGERSMPEESGSY